MNLKQLREKAKLTTGETAERLDISKSMLYKIEEGFRRPSVSLIGKMVTVYKCSYNQIFLAINDTQSSRNQQSSNPNK